MSAVFLFIDSLANLARIRLPTNPKDFRSRLALRKTFSPAGKDRGAPFVTSPHQTLVAAQGPMLSGAGEGGTPQAKVTEVLTF